MRRTTSRTATSEATRGALESEAAGQRSRASSMRSVFIYITFSPRCISPPLISPMYAHRCGNLHASEEPRVKKLKPLYGMVWQPPLLARSTGPCTATRTPDEQQTGGTREAYWDHRVATANTHGLGRLHNQSHPSTGGSELQRVAWLGCGRKKAHVRPDRTALTLARAIQPRSPSRRAAARLSRFATRVHVAPSRALRACAA